MKKITTLLLAILMVLPALAYNMSSGTRMYFDKPSGWSEKASFMLGHNSYSKGYNMSKIGNTNLYTGTVTDSWGDATEWAVFNVTGWGAEYSNLSHRKGYAGNSTSIVKMTGNMSGTYLLMSGSATKITDYASLNHTQTIAIEGEGTTTISTYKLSAVSTASASNGTNSADAAYTATVKCVATAADGYQFVGWYDGATLLSANASYSYTAANAAKTITARFEKLAANTPIISNFAASATNVAAGEVVTFSCDVENGDVADVVYEVNGEAIVGNEWTPTEMGEYTISATLEGAVTQTLTVTVYIKPTVQEGQNIVFFDNTQSNWATVYAYAWEGASGLIAAWPGTPCEYIGNNIWQYECGDKLPGKIIFNNGDNGQQTANLIYLNGGVYTADMEENATPGNVILPEGLNIRLTISTTAYVGDEVTLTSVYTQGFTVKYYVNGVESGETWTPSEARDYTILANLMSGSEVVASDQVVVTVKDHTVFYAYLLKEGAWETTNIYYWGDASNSWPGTALSETETINGQEYYKYAFNDITSVNIIFNNKVADSGVQTSNIENVTATTYFRITNQAGGDGSYEASATPFEVAAPYAETITARDYYFYPGDWAADEAWYAVYFYNRNKATDNYQWVQGYVTEKGLVVFTYGGEDKYTHMIFCRMNPYFLNEKFEGEMQWNKGDEDETGDPKHVWNQTDDLTFDPELGDWACYVITSMGEYGANSTGAWGKIENPTAVEGVKATNGIAYANGIVAAEGAIEVYNVNGMVVARGNESLDLRNLNAGVYIVRNGNNVRKVVR